MAVFAPDRQLTEWRVQESSVAIQDWLRLPAVANDAARKNRAIEPVIPELVSRRKSPAPCFRIKGEWRLEQEVVTSEDGSEAIRSGTDDPIHRVRLAK